MKHLCACVIGATTVAVAALAQDNVEGGWGALFGGNYANARTDQFPIIFSSGAATEVAWELNIGELYGMVAPWGRQQIVFDADGNLYWQSHHNWWTSFSRVVSLDPDGNVRWTFAGPNDAGLGHTSDPLTPIVGEDALYVHSYTIYEPDPDPDLWYQSVRDHWFVYAVNKTDGSTIWATELDNEPLLIGISAGWIPNFTLLNGKLYAIGHPHDDGTRAVYVVDAATGAILHNQAIHGLPSAQTTMDQTNLVAVEGVFDGLTGLYGYWDGQVWGIQVDVDTPANTGIIWNDPAADMHFYYRKSTIYVEEFDLIVTYSVDDALGYEAFAFDPVAGDIILNWGDSTERTSDCHPAGALGFYDDETESVPLYVGSWPDGILRYDVTSAGVDYADEMFFADSSGQPGQFLQILKNPADGHTIAVAGVCHIPTSVRMLDLDGDMSRAPEGPTYVDDVKIYAGPDTANLNLVFSDDFESYTLGSIVGQGGWADASAANTNEGPSQLVIDPVDPNNLVVELSPEVGGLAWEGIQQSLSLPDVDVYRIEYRQYMVNWSQMIYLAPTDDPDGSHGCPFSLNSDYTGAMLAIAWEHQYDANTYLHENAWDQIVLTHDYAAETSEVVVNGATSDVASWLEDGEPKWFYPMNKPNGFAIQLVDTTPSNNPPAAVLLDYNPGVTMLAHLDINITGGPLVGPDGKIYFATWPADNGAWAYDDPLAGRMYALKPYDPTICADANCDGAVNAFDIDPFVIALVSPDAWATQYACSLLEACDINDDGAVNAFDIDPFVVALVSGGCP